MDAEILRSPRLAFLAWLLAATGLTWSVLPTVVRVYQTGERRDFEQEWLSARNYLRGFPVYFELVNASQVHASGD